MNDLDQRAFGGLEQNVRHLSERIAELEHSLERVEAKISNLTDLLNQAKGAKWVVAIVIAGSSFLAGLAVAAKGLLR